MPIRRACILTCIPFSLHSATSDGGFFCGPGGFIFPLRRQSSTNNFSVSGGSPIKLRNSGQLGASYSPDAFGGAGASAGAACDDAYSNRELCRTQRRLAFTKDMIMLFCPT